MITFTYEHEESAHDVTFTLLEDSTATDLVASFSAFMLACGYSQKTIDGAFAEMVTLDAVINSPAIDKDSWSLGPWIPGGIRKPE